MASFQYSVKSNAELKKELEGLMNEMDVIEQETEKVRRDIAAMDRRAVNKYSYSDHYASSGSRYNP